MCVNLCVCFFYSVALNGLLQEYLMKKIALEHHFLLMIIFLHQRHQRRCPFITHLHAPSCFKINFYNKIIYFDTGKAQKTRKNQLRLLIHVVQKHQRDRTKTKIRKGKFFNLLFINDLTNHAISNYSSLDQSRYENDARIHNRYALLTLIRMFFPHLVTHFFYYEFNCILYSFMN
jgi:hypothetical protein